MELLDQARRTAHVTVPATPTVVDDRERAARRALRSQIVRLERELADAFVTAFPMGGLEQAPSVAATEPGCSTSASSSGCATT